MDTTLVVHIATMAVDNVNDQWRRYCIRDCFTDTARPRCCLQAHCMPACLDDRL